jgi:hypothetical protein
MRLRENWEACRGRVRKPAFPRPSVVISFGTGILLACDFNTEIDSYVQFPRYIVVECSK